MPRYFVREHDVVRAEAVHARAVVGIVMLEISDEASGRKLDLDAELSARDAPERGGEPLVLLDAASRHEPGALRRPVDPAADEQPALRIAHQQVEGHEGRVPDDQVEGFPGEHLKTR